jgi:hypothetical protein
MPSHKPHRKLHSDIFEGIVLDGDISVFGKSRNRIKLSFGNPIILVPTPLLTASTTWQRVRLHLR